MTIEIVATKRMFTRRQHGNLRGCGACMPNDGRNLVSIDLDTGLRDQRDVMQSAPRAWDIRTVLYCAPRNQMQASLTFE